MTKLPALFIGRFQPFHLGHIDAIHQILRKEESVIIAIGSAQYYNMPENPWTCSQRFQMIEAGLSDAGVSPDRYKIIPVWNIEDNDEWADHVDRILPPYGAIYSGSKLTRQLYKKQGKHEVHEIKLLPEISATLLREKMLTNENWEQYVTKNVAEKIHNFKKTLREFYSELNQT